MKKKDKMSWTKPALGVSQALRTNLEKVSFCSAKKKGYIFKGVAPLSCCQSIYIHV